MNKQKHNKQVFVRYAIYGEGPSINAYAYLIW